MSNADRDGPEFAGMTFRFGTPSELIAQASEWQHLKPFGYAPGNYMNKCQACKTIVHDLDKRAITCRPCAETAFAQAEQPAAQGEPAAHGFAPNGDGKITDALVVGHNDDPEYNIPLYRIPDPRTAALESLLRDIREEYRTNGHLFTTAKRIEAALGGK